MKRLVLIWATIFAALALLARRVMEQTLFEAGMGPVGLGHSASLGPVESEERAALNGTPTISDTYRPNDQGTDWPPDAFTRMVAGHESPRSIASPALHSYDGDGNMEGLSVFGPFSRQENPTDLAAYTGAVGPVGRSTPEGTPEVTAPDFPTHNT